MSNLHPLLAEYKKLARQLAEEDMCQCILCERLRAIEKELTEALEYAALIGDIKAAVQEAEEHRNER